MLAFDTYGYVKELRAAGVSEEQAEVQANTLKILVENDLSTKHDIKELDAKIETSKKELDAKIEMTRAELIAKIEMTRAELIAKIETSKADLIKWVAGLLIAQAGLIVVLLKLFQILPP